MELLAAALLEERLNLVTYYPEVTVRRHGHFQRGAFFPCYLFVAADLKQTALSVIDYMPGVVRVVRFHDEPRPIANEVIQHLRLRIEDINAAGGLPSHHFHLGDPVRITSGPLRGLEGVFDGPMTPTERVMVLLRFLGTERRVTVGVDAIEPNSNPVPHVEEKRPRRSRGVGRPTKHKTEASGRSENTM
jgi:transcription antitermination factor NusG